MLDSQIPLSFRVILDPIHKKLVLILWFYQQFFQHCYLSYLFLLVMQIVQVIWVAIFEFLLHEYLLDVPRLNWLDLKDRTHSILVQELAELMPERWWVVLPEFEGHFLALVHTNWPEIVVHSESFPNSAPDPLNPPIVDIIGLEIIKHKDLLEMLGIEEILCWDFFELETVYEALLDLVLHCSHVELVDAGGLFDLFLYGYSWDALEVFD